MRDRGRRREARKVRVDTVKDFEGMDVEVEGEEKRSTNAVEQPRARSLLLRVGDGDAPVPAPVLVRETDAMEGRYAIYASRIQLRTLGSAKLVVRFVTLRPRRDAILCAHARRSVIHRFRLGDFSSASSVSLGICIWRCSPSVISSLTLALNRKYRTSLFNSRQATRVPNPQ